METYRSRYGCMARPPVHDYRYPLSFTKTWQNSSRQGDCFIRSIGIINTKVQISIFGQNSSSGCSHDVTLLNKVWLQHVFNGVTLFADGSGKIINSHRAAIELFHHGQQ